MNTQRFILNILRIAKLICIFTGFSKIGFSSARSLPNQDAENHSEDSGSGLTTTDQTSALDIDSLVEHLIAFPPTVTFTITNPFRRHTRFRTTVPLKPEMTVLHGLVSAVQSNSNSINPFNVQLMWDNSISCYVIQKALGVSSNDSYHWTTRIRDWRKQAVYKDRCLPRESVNLGPFYKVNIQYQNVPSS